MSIYNDFAYVYHLGPYTSYSLQMAGQLPAILRRFNCQPHTLLDLACGEGSFAIAQAEQGIQVTGVDASTRMLQIARLMAAERKVTVQFEEMDMRSLDFNETFDLATCWFDSLNYLLELEDLEKAFSGVYRALNPGGLFIFDMNTIYGLAVLWQQSDYTIQQDTPELIEIHNHAYDFEQNISTIKITAFMQEGQLWQRVDETHQERGYPIGQVRDLLTRSGFETLACYGNLDEQSEPEPESGRVWLVARKGGLSNGADEKKLITPSRRRPVKGNRIHRARP